MPALIRAVMHSVWHQPIGVRPIRWLRFTSWWQMPQVGSHHRAFMTRVALMASVASFHCDKSDRSDQRVAARGFCRFGRFGRTVCR